MDGSIYDADYYERGVASGKSLYENYRFLPELSGPMVKRIIEHLGIESTDTVLDFGCAKGFIVKVFRESFGIEAYGVDVSEWAVANADEPTKPYLSCTSEIPPGMDWIIAKDVLEHVPNVEEVVDDMMAVARKGVFVVVPLSSRDGEPYVVADYERDVTHIHRLSLATWARMFMRVGWRVEAMHRLNGVKDNYAVWENGNGFVTARRI